VGKIVVEDPGTSPFIYAEEFNVKLQDYYKEFAARETGAVEVVQRLNL
jgi:hypothetical protein